MILLAPACPFVFDPLQAPLGVGPLLPPAGREPPTVTLSVDPDDDLGDEEDLVVSQPADEESSFDDFDDEFDDDFEEEGDDPDWDHPDDGDTEPPPAKGTGKMK